MRQRTLAKLFLLCVLTTAIVALPSVVKAGKKEDKRIRKAQRTFEDIMDSRDTAIPRSLIRKASGIIILNQFKAGFVFGAKGGKGIVMAKDDRTQRWSPPAFLTVAEGSYGFQIGGQSIATVFLVMSIEKLDRILRGKFKIGVDASAAVGPVGRDAEAKLGAGAAMLTYSIAKGCTRAPPSREASCWRTTVRTRRCTASKEFHPRIFCIARK